MLESGTRSEKNFEEKVASITKKVEWREMILDRYQSFFFDDKALRAVFEVVCALFLIRESPINKSALIRELLKIRRERSVEMFGKRTEVTCLIDTLIKANILRYQNSGLHITLNFENDGNEI